MKKFLNYFGLTALILAATVSHSWALEGSFAFQGGFAQAFGGPSTTEPSFGLNGFAYMDFKIVPGFSLGLGTSFSSLISGPQRLYVDGTHLLGRLEPFTASAWTPYFMVGAGPRPFFDAQPFHRWLKGGDFQALAGAGLRHNLVQGMDLDVSIFYNLNSTTGDALSSVGARAGLAFPFGGSEETKAASLRPHALTVRAAESDSYQVHPGDTLWKISKNKAEGKGHEWKKIYSANQDSIKNPNLIYPKQEIALPAAKKEAAKDQE